jgi:hypothetical protein
MFPSTPVNASLRDSKMNLPLFKQEQTKLGLGLLRLNKISVTQESSKKQSEKKPREWRERDHYTDFSKLWNDRKWIDK